MAARRARKSKATNDTNTLLLALRFVALAQQEIGTLTQTHSMFGGGWLAASDGILTAAAKIEDDLDACPHTRRLLAALERCGAGVAITQTDSLRLSVKSGALRAVVACVEQQQVQVTGPDPLIAPLTPDFLAGCKAIAHISSESGLSVDVMSILIAGPVIRATNRQVMVEFWHANDMPPHVVIPKTAISALIKSGKEPIGFGFTHGRSFTFHFADESWLKSQIFEDLWPNVDKVFAKDLSGQGAPVPVDLFEALNLIGYFSDCGEVKFEPDLLKTVNRESEGAEHDVKGLPEGGRFAIKNLELIAPIAKTLSVKKGDNLAFFYGDRLRGAISCHVL